MCTPERRLSKKLGLHLLPATLENSRKVSYLMQESATQMLIRSLVGKLRACNTRRSFLILHGEHACDHQKLSAFCIGNGLLPTAKSEGNLWLDVGDLPYIYLCSGFLLSKWQPASAMASHQVHPVAEQRDGWGFLMRMSNWSALFASCMALPMHLGVSHIAANFIYDFFRRTYIPEVACGDSRC